MTRTEVINAHIKHYKYTNYLEIGVQNGVNYEGINCKYKQGVDPKPIFNDGSIIEQTSDKFFESIQEASYDIIFIDGLHEAEQVKKDIENALKFLTDNGTIICHDMLPPTKEHQEVPRIQKQWNGDCWKAFVRLRAKRDDLEMYTIDTDWGLGIIKKGSQELLDIKTNELTWGFFERHKQRLMNIQSLKL